MSVETSRNRWRRAAAVIDRISANDLTALVTDRGPAPMNIAAVLLVEGGEDLDRHMVTRLLAERLDAVPRMRQRLMHAPPGCGRPYWVDDVRFHVERHLQFGRVEGETGERGLWEHVAAMVCTPLARDRPLWSARWVNGIGQGRAAMVIVAHHVVADGIGGLALLAALADHPDRPEPLEDQHNVEARLARTPDPAGQAVRHTGGPTAAALAVEAWRTRLRGLRQIAARARVSRAGIRDLGIGRERPQLAPRTSLNRPTGPHRRLGRIERPLEDVVSAAHRHGCTVNDMVLTAVVGAVTDVLDEGGEPVESMVVSVPYSSRSEATTDQLGNRTGVVPFRIPAHGATALVRLRAVTAQSRAQRGRARAASSVPLGVAFRFLARVGAFSLFIEHQRLVNTFVTNVRGPSRAIYFGGREVSRIVPVAVTPGNTSVTFDVLSYAGWLGITVVADPDALPDPSPLADQIGCRLDELVTQLPE